MIGAMDGTIPPASSGYARADAQDGMISLDEPVIARDSRTTTAKDA
jgi:hypothetical protein